MSSDNSTGQTSFDCLIAQMFDYYNITTDLPDTVEPTWTAFAVINGIAAPPTTVLNFLIIWTILRDSELKSVTHNILLLALAVTDCLEGLIVEPLFCWYLVSLIKRSPIPCHYTVYSIPAIVLSCWTLNTLMVASVDMYLAIEHFQFYLENVTTKKVAIVTAIVWAANVSFVLIGTVVISLLQWHNMRMIPSATVMVINILITICCTMKVQITAHRQRRSIQAQAQAVQQENTSEDNRRRQQHKHIVAMSLVILSTFLFYCPYIINAFIQFTQGKDVTDDFQYVSNPIVGTFIHLQSLVNPIVFALRLSYIREGVKKILLWRSV